ncbi:MAG TPA: phosphoribosyltransferase [Chthoniobacteraceae bacterium]|jgi:predicted phosphoribosyltransferase|nr:phosphoribosyltransferase [Chthoniobacteraceae bacterium]
MSRRSQEWFQDRADAGRRLAQKLLAAGYGPPSDAIVLALPRGGVPVGFEVAQALGLPLDVFIVRKLGVPGFEELAMGALASGGVRVLNPGVLREVRDGGAVLAQVTSREAAEIERREAAYRGGRPAPEPAGKTAILVDDGLATGATMRAAVAALRRRAAGRIVVAVPVGAPEVCAALASEADEAVCLIAPEGFQAVGQFYRDFTQTSDEEVRALLARATSVR